MDQPPKKRPLSEISHLFLSDVRSRQTHGAPPPRRTPPKADISIDMTPDEFAKAFGAAVPAAAPTSERGHVPEPVSVKRPQIAAILGSHLNGQQMNRARQLARFLAHHEQRVGMIELDVAELRLTRFEPLTEETDGPAPGACGECVDPRQLAEALEELNWDVDQWLLVVSASLGREARVLLGEVNRWVLLCTGDHDGVVAGYRTLKGLAELHRPHLSLALLDASEDVQTKRVFDKLSGVCRQFLDWPLEEQIAVQTVDDVTEQLVVSCRQSAETGSHGTLLEVVGVFLAKAKPAATPDTGEAAAESATDADNAAPASVQGRAPRSGGNVA